jgi:hypothetical protein
VELWCGTCYGPTKAVKYPVKELPMEDGKTAVPGLQVKHLCVRARHGDNLLCPL